MNPQKILLINIKICYYFQKILLYIFLVFKVLLRIILKIFLKKIVDF